MLKFTYKGAVYSLEIAKVNPNSVVLTTNGFNFVYGLNNGGYRYLGEYSVTLGYALFVNFALAFGVTTPLEALDCAKSLGDALTQYLEIDFA